MNEKPSMTIKKSRPVKEKVATELCKHDYRIGFNNLELVVFKADEEIKYTSFDGSALFYCTKCLHIETKVYK